MASNTYDSDEQYLDQKVHHILEPLLYNALRSQTDCPIKYMIEWLRNYLGIGGNKNNSEREELLMLRREVKKYIKKYPKGTLEDDMMSEDDEVMSLGEQDKIDKEMEMATIKLKKNRMRSSVSAEAYGQFHKKEAYTPKVIKKTNDQIERIHKKMMENFMFNQLDEKEFKTVIDAFQEKKVNPKEVVINEGDKGDIVYLIDSGELDCHKKINKTQTYLKTYIPGEAFGELALLYNAPRAATITAKTKCLLWALDRATFNAIVKNAAIAKREKYEKTLKRIEILQTMSEFELGQICDAMKMEKVKSGTKMISQNEEGNKFYLIEEGEAYATKIFQDKDKDEEEIVFEYKAGDYFGELALLKNEPRAANVYAKSDCKLITLDRRTFKRLLGPLENLLKRNSEAYVKYMTKS